jgi:FixJ family two-component response regulator
MAEPARILIADDEETFLHSTADLLRREGFHCDTAADATSATELIRNAAFDLVIADIRMPGNSELQFISELTELASGLPVILVTGYPSLRTAIRSIELLVVAYLIKPVVFQELLDRVRMGTERHRTYRAISSTRKQLQDWQQKLAGMENWMAHAPGDVSHVPVSTFLDLTLRNVVDALSDLKALTETLALQRGSQDACHLLGCPRPIVLLEAIRETIGVLESTKSSFKSKELGELRQKLDGIVKMATLRQPAERM